VSGSALTTAVGAIANMGHCSGEDIGVIAAAFVGQGVAAEGLSVGAPPGPEVDGVMSWIPCLVRSAEPSGGVRTALGHRLVDEYLEFVAASLATWPVPQPTSIAAPVLGLLSQEMSSSG